MLRRGNTARTDNFPTMSLCERVLGSSKNEEPAFSRHLLLRHLHSEVRQNQSTSELTRQFLSLTGVNLKNSPICCDLDQETLKFGPI